MTISNNDWGAYVSKLRKLSDTAANKLQDYINKNGIENTEAIIEYAYALVTKYGEGSAELACQMYDAIAETENVIVPSAVPAATASYSEIARAVNGSLLQSAAGNVISSIADRYVKMAAADTTLQNAVRDGAYWAWVPSGDTCAFCITLASRGWQRASKRVLKGGHAEHIHAHCDCQFAISLNGKGNVAGYDPDKYLKMYRDAEGNSSKEKVNSLRRELNVKQRMNNKMLKLGRDGNIYVNKIEDLYSYALKIKPEEGYTDIVSHGDEYSLIFKDGNGKESNVSAEEFCNILDEAGIYKGGDIRLIACSTGAKNGIVPRYMAKRYGVNVKAPTETVNVLSDGSIILANDDNDAKMGIETGEWALFNAEGRIL